MSARVLIAEDEPSIVACLEFLMRRCGFETRSVADGLEVMRAVEDFVPDVVLLDVMLPNRSGFELCREIRGREARPRVLMLTAMGAKGDVAGGLAAGADDYLTKPFSTQDLVQRVRALLVPGRGTPA
jgi:DNA-binding response OmpR family regulator